MMIIIAITLCFVYKLLFFLWPKKSDFFYRKINLKDRKKLKKLFVHFSKLGLFLLEIILYNNKGKFFF